MTAPTDKTPRPSVPPASALRPTRAEVEPDAIARNLATLRDAVGRARVLTVVKADAYGHGAVPVAKRLAREGVFGFGVALAEEGFELRDAGVESAILVLNGVHGGAHRRVVAAGLTPVVYEPHEREAFAATARALGDDVGVHIKVDTGMSRLGVPFTELDAFLDALESEGGVRIDGLMTHLACAGEDEAFTRMQLERFEAARARVRERGHRPTLVHAANSAAALAHPEARYDLVRVGIALYGYSPVPCDLPLEPALRWRTRIISLRTIPAGAGVGYSQTYRATRRTRIATLPVGYGDGYVRSYSNRAEVLVRGIRCPLVGNVSMDLVGVDVTGVPGAEVGDEAVLLGRQGEGFIGAPELAAWGETLPYEVLTHVSRRVPRAYPGGDVV